MAIDGGGSGRGGIIDNIKLDLYKYFCFSETKKSKFSDFISFQKKIDAINRNKAIF